VLDHHLFDQQRQGMKALFDNIWDNHFWMAAACFFAALVVISALADRKRSRRSKVEDVGFMPWTSITVFSVLLSVISAALAIKSA
jgi:hypothetical protein